MSIRNLLCCAVAALATTAEANLRCQGVLARTYAAAQYTEGVVNMLWGVTEHPQSNGIDVLVDALEDANSPRTRAQAAAVRHALILESGGSPAFFAEATPWGQAAALRNDPGGDHLLSLWRESGWTLSPSLRQQGFGVIIRNGVPRELHVPVPRQQLIPRMFRAAGGMLSFVRLDDRTVRGLLARFPTIRRVVGMSEAESLRHLAYVACFGHPGGVYELERVLLADEPDVDASRAVVASLFRWWHDQPRGFDGPSNVSHAVQSILDRLPEREARLAAWIRGEPAQPEDFLDTTTLLAHSLFGPNAIPGPWIAQRFDAMYDELPAAARRQVIVHLRRSHNPELYSTLRHSRHRDVQRMLDAEDP